MTLYTELIYFIERIIIELHKETGNPIDEIIESIIEGIKEKVR